MLKPIPQLKQIDCQSAQPLTLRALFDAEEGPLLRYAFSLTGRRAVAEEIVQEVFLQLHSRWDEVDAPRAWLFLTARNRAYNFLRDHKREVLQGDEQESPSSDDETPAANLQRIEKIVALRQIVEELGEPDRTIVKMKYFDELKYREISEQTGLTISNVGYRLHHILKVLAEKLRPLGIDE
ncbi:MAG: sigma-70 family RNA polymerase sigma factor [Pirellulaceae bacterium]